MRFDLSAWRNRLVESIPGTILEIGVGAGANLPRYRRADTIIAFEPDGVRALDATKAAVGNAIPVAVAIAVAELIPFQDASFDHVVSSLVFCSVADQRLALREIARVLRPGGRLHMIEHIRPQAPPLAAIATSITPYWRRMAHNCHLDRPTIDVLRDEGWHVRVVGRRGVFVHAQAHIDSPVQ